MKGKEMKKLIVFALVSVLLFGAASAYAEAAPVLDSSPSPAYSDEMKIPYTVDLSPEDGADSVERAGDHQESPYFRHPDFYHMEDTDTLTILTGFRTQQQTSEWSCGVSSVLMVLDWYGKLGDHNEETLAAFRENGLTPGATTTRGAGASSLPARRRSTASRRPTVSERGLRRSWGRVSQAG
ncbi:hypothetical protein SDC9_110265 [bioreactor metagenome]|uniref:Peptidase C39-like domain-containing protein n=1 Tax=bioreactor metagenome TaxID=1076179 RepID=A0A645BD57_9ZZZZ